MPRRSLATPLLGAPAVSWAGRPTPSSWAGRAARRKRARLVLSSLPRGMLATMDTRRRQLPWQVREAQRATLALLDRITLPRTVRGLHWTTTTAQGAQRERWVSR